jgi:hypothetical protein
MLGLYQPSFHHRQKRMSAASGKRKKNFIHLDAPWFPLGGKSKQRAWQKFELFCSAPAETLSSITFAVGRVK